VTSNGHTTKGKGQAAKKWFFFCLALQDKKNEKEQLFIPLRGKVEVTSTKTRKTCRRIGQSMKRIMV